MSQENVEIVRRMWDAFLTADFQTALSFYAPDLEWDGTNLPDGQIGTGHEAILNHVTQWADAWDHWTVEIERVVEAGGDRSSSSWWRPTSSEGIGQKARNRPV